MIFLVFVINSNTFKFSSQTELEEAPSVGLKGQDELKGALGVF